MSNDVVFKVDIRDVVVDANDLAELVYFLRNKKFIYKDYVGSGKGMDGSDYNYQLVKCNDKSRVEITPVDEGLWLYLNTFGKETK